MNLAIAACTLAGIVFSLDLPARAEDLSAEIERGMISADREVAMQAVAACTQQGASALPQLREWSGSDDPRLRVRARMAIGQITGQWGSQTDLVWGRSFDKAKGQGKPILLLQLFGNLDEEFC